MLASRIFSPTQIQYYLVTHRDNYSYMDYLIGPESFSGTVRSLLRTAPNDLFQLLNPDLFYKMRVNGILPGGLEFNVHYTDNFDGELTVLEHPGVTVLLLSKLTAEEMARILGYLIDKPNLYCYPIEPTGPINALKMLFPDIQILDDILQLTDKLVADMDHIFARLASDRPKLVNSFAMYRQFYGDHPRVDVEKKNIPLFQAAQTNYFTWCQITGIYWQYRGDVDPSTQEQLNQLRREAALTRERDDHARYRLILEGAELIDACWKDEDILPAVSSMEPAMNPILLCMPFQNPQSEKVASLFDIDMPQEIIEHLLLEQNFNYVFQKPTPDFYTREKVIKRQMMMAATGEMVLSPRLLYLDFLLYIHSSFTLSPVYRFPLAGRSLNTSLAFLKPNTRNNLTAHKLNQTIAQLSTALNRKLMYDKLEKYLRNRDGQVIALSDLPVELIHIDGLPLVYTHDVCRIPETNYKMAMSLYMMQNMFSYVIPEDLASNTLVLLGAPNDPDFRNTNERITERCTTLGIKCQSCSGVADFKALVEQHKPEFLIVDCHGNFSADELSSYLIINGENLTHDAVLSIQHIIPLVFLSACSTSPTYGYVHSIANAFFNKGTMSVTTTLLPINVERGTAFYARMLNMLDEVSKSGRFPNWLSFMGYITRTAVFYDIFKKAEKQTAKIKDDKVSRTEMVMEGIEALIQESETFSTRPNLFLHLNERLNNLDPEVRIDYNKLTHEHLLYSHMGRSDLIYFESWQKKRRDQITQIVEMIVKPGS